MTRPQLIVVECVIIAIGLAVLALVITWPFASDESASASPEVTVRAARVATPAATGAPSPGATPDEECAPAVNRSFLSANTIVSYYGHPYAETLGILGQHEPEELVALLQEHARQIDELNGIRGVQPAFHMVWGTAQPQPGDEGLYVLHVDPETTQEYIDLACRNRFLIFLDLQNGRSDPLDELRRIEPYLRSGHVHVAIDPEFTMREGEAPGQVIGHVTAEQINAVQAELERIVQENNLPGKILIVHQFDEGMIRDREAIQQFPDVHVVVDMDGFGPGDVKIRKYGMFSQPAEHGAIKIFFQQDNPRLSDADVVALRPEVIIYQ
jgi:hypothetical protein